MKIIIKDEEKIYLINKSKFIGIVKKVYNKEEIDQILLSLKKEYYDATHICYAYILPNIKKCSDDGEPSGTAGLPILNILEKNDLCYTLAIVIRYFGGIKLGSNVLIRSYSNTVSLTIDNNIKDIEYGYLIKIKSDYKNIDKLDYLLKNEIIIKKEYLDKIIVYAIIRKKILEDISSFHYEIMEEKII